MGARTIKSTGPHPHHIHVAGRDRSFPSGRPEELEEDSGVALPDEPTSTPDLLLKSPLRQEPERSERIAADERIVPVDDPTVWLERAEDDGPDAARPLPRA